MNGSSSDLAGMLCHCQTAIASLLRQEAGREERADRLADLLREMIPTARLTACLLGAGNAGWLAARSAKDSIAQEQNNLLRSQINSFDPFASGVQALPSAGGRTLAAAIHEDGRSRGFLVIGLDADATAEEVARAETLLAVCASTVALREALETVRDEQAELARFALVGQAFVGLAHELNNALNSMMLQTSVVQMRVDQQARTDLATIRQHGAQAAGLVRSLQHVVNERREKSYAVDLNSALATMCEEQPELGQRLSVRFAEEAPLLQSTRSAVKQFVRLVLEGVCAGTKSAVEVRTEKGASSAALIVAIAEAPAETEDEGAPSPAHTILWQHLDEVGRQAGLSLLRQLGGMLAVEQSSSGGVNLRITWEEKA
jgi:C4-dicarboxylate-specific signal transduction histidine kinase